ncbi:MAG: ComF family protein [Clostridia bacterium]|nr:ComF family protein [Clostridia bacterium]
MFVNDMEYTKKKYGIFKRIINAFLPERCPYCNKVVALGEKACDECLRDFPEIIYIRRAIGGYLTVSPLPFMDNFSKAIKRFKFKRKTQFATQLATPIAEAVAKEYKDFEFDMISCVPLHPRKLNERGFNQSEILAREVSEMLSVPFEHTLIKTKHNEPQHSLKGDKRKKNVKGVYKVKDKMLIKNKRILLIDDIITSGNTLGECAKMLDIGGAEIICCATFATVVAKTT